MLVLACVLLHGWKTCARLWSLCCFCFPARLWTSTGLSPVCGVHWELGNPAGLFCCFMLMWLAHSPPHCTFQWGKDDLMLHTPQRPFFLRTKISVKYLDVFKRYSFSLTVGGGIYVCRVVAAPAVVRAIENNKDVFLLTYAHSTNEFVLHIYYRPQQQKN